MSVGGPQDCRQEPSPRRSLKGVAAGAVILVALVLLMPLAFRGVYGVEPTCEGYIACYVGRNTSLSILFNDYGRWPWLNASGTFTSIMTDNPDLEVTSFTVAPVFPSVHCQRMAIRLEVTPRSEGEHYLTSLTIVRGGVTRALPVGRVLFDARLPAHDGVQLLVDMSPLIFLKAWHYPYDRPGEYSPTVWVGSRPVEVSLFCSRLPEGVVLTSEPVQFDWRGAFLKVHLRGETGDGQLRRRVLLVRPWLAVASDRGETLEPGPLYMVDWPSSLR